MTRKNRYLSHMEQPEKISTHILELADRCVKCGLCIPQCPTYALNANENESPRGRIALIQGWLSGDLAPSKTLTQHLNQCLLCRRCERLCPSKVPYGELMDQSKALLIEQTQATFSFTSFINKLGLKLLLGKKSSGLLVSGLRLLQASGLIGLINKSGLFTLLGLQRLIAYLPKLNKPIRTKDFYPATNSAKGNVALFTGCISKQLDPKTVKASIHLLNQLGYGVYVPKEQVCCGALHLHDGNKKTATHFANSNIKLFNRQNNITAVVSLVNGCSSQLRDYSQLDTNDALIPQVKDIIEFFSESEWPENIQFKPLNKNVTLQIPCSLQNSLRAEDKLMTLLQRIPGINLSSDKLYNQCCGAAGSYFLRFPEISDQLKASALNSLTRSQPEMIISSNLGCALQLKAGLKQQNQDISVIHPVLLLEQQLKRH